MKKALADLFSSKKFIVMLTAVIAYAAARFGWDVDMAKIEPILLLVGGWLGMQGLADHGKEKAKVEAASAAAARAAAAPAAAPPG